MSRASILLAASCCVVWSACQHERPSEPEFPPVQARRLEPVSFDPRKVGAPAPRANPQVTGNARPSLAPLVEDVRGVVVGVTTLEEARSRATTGRSEQQWRDFFSGKRERPPAASPDQPLGVGSGVIVDSRGLVLTNNHVLEDAKEVLVRTGQEVEYRADVIGRDPEADIAVLRMRDVHEPLPAATLGSSDGLRVGDYVVAIGNPFGLEFSVSSGIISAKSRVIGAGPFDEFLQTDAAINPGNSGGPLFDLEGRVVGIATAIVAGGQGIGFAVPIDLVKALLPQLVDEGRVERGYLGVAIQDLTPTIARAVNAKETEGAVVVTVDEDSPAARAGVKPGDVVVAVNDAQVAHAAVLSRNVAVMKPGQTVNLDLRRGGRERSARIKLAERPRSFGR